MSRQSGLYVKKKAIDWAQLSRNNQWPEVIHSDMDIWKFIILS